LDNGWKVRSVRPVAGLMVAMVMRKPQQVL
jgi:hypothetical protein